MGRRPDPPEVQAAKGFPGRRRKSTEKRIAAAEELAAKLAAAAGPGGDRLAPPLYLTDREFAPALTVWRDLVPKLDRRNLYSDLDRENLASYCVYAAMYAKAVDHVTKHGEFWQVKTVSGDLMPRMNPYVERMDVAANMMLKYSRCFGLTPLDRYGLEHQQSQAPSVGLFAPTGEPAAAPSPASPRPAQEETPSGPIGILSALDSTPPTRPN